MSIKLTDLSHEYLAGTPAARIVLRHITLEIPFGTCLGIAGGTGSGKTTLIQHLNGILPPGSGSITIDGIADREELRRRVGIVFQYPEAQLFEETVFKEIAFGLSGRGMSPAAIEQRVSETLSAVGLGEELLGKSPFCLSGGEKRRVAIAGVLVSRPEILVLDEPGAGLDPQGRYEILNFLAKLRRDTGLTLILVSHNMEDLVRLAEEIVVLKNGAVVRSGKTRDVFLDHHALGDAGLVPPQITSFMRRLRETLPEISDGILTVTEAREELRRVFAQQGQREGRG